ncbi:MAG: PF20097 family protein [Candidatus Thorarchaeota archaeon]|nr:PF20097 family protein [Candidatus Thorarchaeota archaeon]
MFSRADAMEKSCTKCGASMESGTLAGAPAWGSGTGAFKKKQVKVFAYRCPSCGYIGLWEGGK